VKQKVDAHRLKELLKPYKISGWVAHDDIEPTKHWQKEIEKALNSMDIMIAILTDDFHNSVWCQQEIGSALGRQVEIIPLKFKHRNASGKIVECDPKGFLSAKQACIAQEGKTIQKIIDTIRESKTVGDLYNEINPLPKIDDTDDIPF